MCKFKLPGSLDKALANITGKPTQVLGGFIESWLYLRFGNTIHKANMKKALQATELKEFLASTTERINAIPNDKLQKPDSQIVNMALDSVLQTNPDSTVREIFSNLIASSVDADLAIHTHVAFIEIAKQLSSTDEHIFKLLTQFKRIPVCKVFLLDDPDFDETMSMFDDIGFSGAEEDDPCVQFPNLSGTDISMHYTLLDEIMTIPHFKAEQSFDNLSRLGLIALDYTITAPNVSYEPFKELPDIAHYFSKDENNIAHKLIPGVCSLTRFGKSFATVCLA